VRKIKIFITGIAGALGSQLAGEFLERGHVIEGCDIKRRHEAHKLDDIMEDIKYIWSGQGDLKDKHFMGVDVVVPAAAVADRPLGLSSPIHTFQTNVMSYLHLLESLRGFANPPLILYPSSGTILATRNYDKLPTDEFAQPTPNNPYSASKYFAEELTRTYHRCFDNPVVILRSGMVLGPGMRTDISVCNWMIEAIKDHEIFVYSPEATRTPTYITDVADAWMKVIEQYRQIDEDVTGKRWRKEDTVVGKTFHTVYPKEYSVIDMARTVHAVVSQDLPYEVDLIQGKYEKGEKVGGRPVREKIVNDFTRDFLDWEPEVSFREAVIKTWRWVKSEYWSN